MICSTLWESKTKSTLLNHETRCAFFFFLALCYTNGNREFFSIPGTEHKYITWKYIFLMKSHALFKCCSTIMLLSAFDYTLLFALPLLPSEQYIQPRLLPCKCVKWKYGRQSFAVACLFLQGHNILTSL